MTVRLAHGLLARAGRGTGLLCLVLVAPPDAALSWLRQAGEVLQRTPLTSRGLPDEPETPGLVSVLPHPDGALLLADTGDVGRAARRRAVETVIAVLDQAGAEGELRLPATMQGRGPVLSPACGAYLVLSSDADAASVVRRLMPHALPSGRGTARLVITEEPVDREAVVQMVQALPWPARVAAYDTDSTSWWSSIATGWTVARHSRLSLHLGLAGPSARLPGAWEQLREAMVSVAGDLAYGCVYGAPDSEWLAGPPTFALPQFVTDDDEIYRFYQEPDVRVPGVFWAQVLGPGHEGTVTGVQLEGGRRLIQLGPPGDWLAGAEPSQDRARLGLG